MANRKQPGEAGRLLEGLFGGVISGVVGLVLVFGLVGSGVDAPPILVPVAPIAVPGVIAVIVGLRQSWGLARRGYAAGLAWAAVAVAILEFLLVVFFVTNFSLSI
ncbi:MAG: hypothetical protein ACYS0E_13050 [Planctomycetota bacterium]